MNQLNPKDIVNPAAAHILMIKIGRKSKSKH